VIHFFVDHDGAHGIRAYLEGRGAALRDTIVPAEYDSLLQARSVPVASAIFAGVDQLGPAGRVEAGAICRALAARPGIRALNDASRVLGRFDLLRVLHERQVNQFRAVRASEPVTGLRYPVFIREEHLHTGALTPPLPDPSAVETALLRLALHGRRRGDLLIVEFCDTRDEDGLYRKYSAMRVGDRLLPRHLHASAHWVSKSNSSTVDEGTVLEERRYFDTNPHERALWDVFRLANIEFGRVDYGFCRGALQVWEINTNPTLARNPGASSGKTNPHHRALVEPGRLIFHRQFVEALRALDTVEKSGDLPIVIESADRKRILEEHGARRRRRGRRRLTQKIIDLTAVQTTRRVWAPLVELTTHLLARQRANRRP
jgi:hypothetical protein